MGRLFYRLARHKFAGQYFLRWLQIAPILIGGAALLGWLPGGWLIAGAMLLLLAGLVAGHRTWQARDFVAFQPAEMPLITPATLSSSAKLPIWASGYFGVENRQHQFAWLQGFFRTFPSREHAVISLNQPTSFLWLGRSPEHLTGMWYIFFKPEAVQDIRWGEIGYGPETLPGLAVTHTVHIPRRNWFQPEKDVSKTTYLAFPERDDALAVLADLLYDRFAAEAASQRSRNGHAKKHPQDTWQKLAG